MSLDVVSQVWTIAKTMMTDTIGIVQQHPLLIVTLVAVPLVGLGIGLFKRLVS